MVRGTEPWLHPLVRPAVVGGALTVAGLANSRPCPLMPTGTYTFSLETPRLRNVKAAFVRLAWHLHTAPAYPLERLVGYVSSARGTVTLA